MRFSLNDNQAQALANFFFDVAKGLVLGGIGFATVASLQTKLITVSLSAFLTFWCIKTALSLLERNL